MHPAPPRASLPRPAALLALALGAGASCYTSSLPEPGTAPAPPPAPPAPFTMTAAAIGPLTARTPATLAALRQQLVGFEVVPGHLALTISSSHLAYTVYDGDERLLQIVPSDAGEIRHVQAVSPKVAVAGHPWRVGAPLRGVRALPMCRCWAEELVACFQPGEHVAVAFARECTSEGTARDDDERQDLIGHRILRLIWTPAPLTEDSNPYGGDEYGGDG